MKTTHVSELRILCWPFMLLLIFMLLASAVFGFEAPIINGKSRMGALEGQILSIMNYRTGQTYTWSIEAGGGTLSATFGERIEYTAPASNPDCTQNPTIRVTDSQGHYQAFNIALSCYPYSEHHAYSDYIDEGCTSWGGFGEGGCTACIRQYSYNCTGDVVMVHGHNCSQCFPPADCSCCYNKVDWWTNYKTVQEILDEPPRDLRTENQKQQGCCPRALFSWYEPGTVLPDDVYRGRDSQLCIKGESRYFSISGEVGNPVSVVNGNNIETAEDLRFASANRNLFVFARYYNSRSSRSGAFGFGWTHTYSAFLKPLHTWEGQNYLKIVDETGRGVYFKDAGAGVYQGAFKELTWVRLEGDSYVWHRHDGRRWGFNAGGQLIWSRDAAGNRIDLSYTSQGALDTVTDASSGRMITLHYNADNRVDYLLGPVTPAVADGKWVQFGYDANGNLASVLYADGSGLEYAYSDAADIHNLTEKRDKQGHLLTRWRYDAQDRAVESFTPDGPGVHIHYLSDNEVEVTDAYGNTRTYGIWDVDGRRRITDVSEPEGCQGCGEDVVRIEYDAMLRVIEAEFAGGLIEQYDDFESLGNAQTVTFAVGTAEEKTVAYTFHAETGQPLSRTEASLLGPGDMQTIWDYDDDGDEIPNEDPGRLLRRKIEKGYTKDPSGAIVAYEYITAYTYNGKGQIVSIDGPRSGSEDALTAAYDPVTGDLLSVTVPLVGTTTYCDHDPAGQPGRITDPNGHVTTIGYDGRGRIIRIVNETDGGITALTYNSAGRIEQVTRPNGVTFEFEYDTVYGRLTRVVDPFGHYTQYGYDDQGSPTALSHHDAAEQRHFFKQYDYHGPSHPGKLWREINPDGTYSEYTYSAAGNIESFRDPAGQSTSYEYDTLNRLVVRMQPGPVTTRYAYDRRGNLASIIDGKNHATTYRYDDPGRLVGTTSPDTGTTTYAYDPAGNLMAKTDASGNTVTYAYDAANRLVGIHFADSAQDITYGYDSGENGKGRLTQMTDPGGATRYAYDKAGNLLCEERTCDGRACSTRYTYDRAGLLTAITYPTGRAVTYGLDPAGRVSRVTTAKDGVFDVLAENIEYLPFGPMKSYTFGNGVSVTHGFDPLYRLTDQNVETLQHLSYARDATGNITAVADHLEPARNQYFTYDDLYRLTGATGIYGAASYTYDAIGNRLTRTVNGRTDTYSYLAGTSRLDQLAGDTFKGFSHDANGNTTAAGTVSLVYNQNDRLIQAAENAAVLGDYVYNGNGQRVKKTVSASTTLYHYDLFGNLIAESTAAADPVAEYVYLNSARLAAFMPKASRDITVSVSSRLSGALANVPVYAFTTAGSYTGKHAVTDADGMARFALSDLPDGACRFRADYLTCRFWSDVVTLPGDRGTHMEIADALTTVQVTQSGSAKEGVKVYVFNGQGTYLGIFAVTDENGEAFFNLPAGSDFRFRADILGNRFFSETVTIVSGGENTWVIDSGGGTLSLTVEKAAADPIRGIPVYLFNAAGAYLGVGKKTDDLGRASFEVPSGGYKIRVDYLGYRFWTEGFSVPETSEWIHLIPHRDITITVQKQYNDDVLLPQGLKMYLFTPSGSYLGLSAVTDTRGQATFGLPEKDYTVRADYLGRQYWSGIFNGTDETITIHEGMGEVHVYQGASPLKHVNVYAFNDSGTYLGMYDQTDEYGVAAFRLPHAGYKFRADYQGNQYWAAEPVTADEVNVIQLHTGGGAFGLTIQKDAADPLRSIPVYVFSPKGTYLGMSSQTDDQGMVSFDLSDGDYTFRADYLGYPFFTGQCTVPNTLSDVLDIAHQDVTISVNAVCGLNIDPLPGIRVYLFTSAGSYRGVYGVSDDQGQVVFNLPQKDYKVRADYLGGQYWSDVFNQQDTTVHIDHAVARIHVSLSGQDVANAPVYVFSESGSYLGRYQRTDESGVAGFTLPAKAYTFRVDYGGTQHWSNVLALLAHEENHIPLDLGLLALDRTNDPDPVRHDGKPPQYTPERVLVASIGALPGILVQSLIGQTPPEKVYYYVNDHLGTPVKMMDENATVVWSADYLPFGQALITVDTIENNFRFPGQYHDQETGLHYNYFRYYNPEAGRYMRPDPIGLAGMDPNLYGYCLNDPVNLVDPHGLIIGTFLSKIGKRIVGQTAQEAAIGGKIIDSGISAVLVFDHGKIVPEPTTQCVKDILIGLEGYGAIQTLSLANITGAAAIAGSSPVWLPVGLSGIAGLEIGGFFNDIYERVSGQTLGEDIYGWINTSQNRESECK